MPFTHAELGWTPGRAAGAYGSTVKQLHNALYKAKVGADFRLPCDDRLLAFKLLIIPSLYVADDALLKRISEYVHNGGHVLMTFKNAFTNENPAVRWEKAPGPLHQAADMVMRTLRGLMEPLWHVETGVSEFGRGFPYCIGGSLQNLG